jgi:hypothetical protein
MANDPRYDSRFLSQGTTQAEVIYNELIGRIAAAHMTIKSRTTTAPPGSPSDFDAYLVPTGASAPWDVQIGNIAIYASGWVYMDARAGMRAYVEDEDRIIDFHFPVGFGKALTGHKTIAPVAGEVQLDGSLGVTFDTTLTENSLLKAPLNFVPGRSYALYIKQDGVGNRSLDYESGGWVANSLMAVSTGANVVDLYTFVGGSATYKTTEVTRTLAVSEQ